MAVNTASGTQVYIATVVWTEAMTTTAAYEALTWVKAGELETVGDIGDQWEEAEFVGMDDSRKRRFKTIKDGGRPDVVCGRDPLDVGQLAFVAASEVKFVYPIKVEYDDAPGPDYTNTIQYFGAQVMGQRTNVGSASNILRRTFPLAINTVIITDESNFAT